MPWGSPRGWRGSPPSSRSWSSEVRPGEAIRRGGDRPRPVQDRAVPGRRDPRSSCLRTRRGGRLFLAGKRTQPMRDMIYQATPERLTDTIRAALARIGTSEPVYIEVDPQPGCTQPLRAGRAVQAGEPTPIRPDRPPCGGVGSDRLDASPGPGLRPGHADATGNPGPTIRPGGTERPVSVWVGDQVQALPRSVVIQAGPRNPAVRRWQPPGSGPRDSWAPRSTRGGSGWRSPGSRRRRDWSRRRCSPPRQPEYVRAVQDLVRDLPQPGKMRVAEFGDPRVSHRLLRLFIKSLLARRDGLCRRLAALLDARTLATDRTVGT
jgi:hypothetical protein